MGDIYYFKEKHKSGKVIFPFNNLFKNVEWVDFKIGKLFEKIKTNKIEGSESGELAATTAVLSNNQIGRYVKREGATILKNVFSATANGTGKAFFQSQEFTVLQDSYAFTFIDKDINVLKIHPFIVSVLNSVYSKYNWGNKSGWDKIKNEEIKLPIKEDGSLNIEAIEYFVENLKNKQFIELENYLIDMSLKDYILVEKEIHSLEDLEIKKWEAFNIEDLFYKAPLKFNKDYFDKDKDVSREQTSEFNIPLVNAKEGENGIMYYGKEEDFDTTEMSIDIISDGAISTGSVFPQPQKTGVLYNAYLIKPKFDINRKILIFLATSIKKSIKHKFGYENKAGWEKVKKETIQLPIKEDNTPDFEFMEDIVSAIQKLIIKDVVLYVENKKKEFLASARKNKRKQRETNS